MNTDYTLSESQLQQALAANERLIQVIEKNSQEGRKMRRMGALCAAVYLLCSLAVVALIGALASGVTVSVTSEESEITQDSGGGSGNNLYFSGDATYNERGLGDG